jgi:broad specificity phosphatase PhoE
LIISHAGVARALGKLFGSVDQLDAFNLDNAVPYLFEIHVHQEISRITQVTRFDLNQSHKLFTSK